jgi:phosphoglycolate phosphatase-like HAD superfamily hydrolase
VDKEQTSRRGLFVDLDGTLADSLGLLRKVYFRFMEKFGRKGSDSEFNQPARGPSGFGCRAAHVCVWVTHHFIGSMAQGG